MSRLEIVIVTRKGAREVTHFLTIRDLAGFASDLLIYFYYSSLVFLVESPAVDKLIHYY